MSYARTMVACMKLVVRLKLMPSPQQAAALEETLRMLNEQANWVSKVAYARKAFRNYGLRRLTYARIRNAGIGSQAAQHVIKKVADAYAALTANIRSGNYGSPGSKRRQEVESKPIVFRPDAAHPYDQRNLSFALDARTISLWTVVGRLKDVPFACSPVALTMLEEHKRGEADLLRRDGVWYLGVALEVPEAGVPVIFVNPAYSSQECAECGHTSRLNRVSQALFTCRSCGVVAHADRNASRVLARRGQSAWNAGRTSHVPAASQHG